MEKEEKQAFLERYASMAMDQQVRYGIPASVTLAQLALESGWGKGRGIIEGNNAFCVKGTYNGNYILISDDKPNEKFKSYGTLQESFDDHSKVLMGKHYVHCQCLDSTDYKGWCIGLQSGESTGGKYATDPRYTQTLVSIIENYNLSKYDQQAVVSANSQGIAVGYMRNLSSDNESSSVNIAHTAHWVMPLDGNILVQTCEYGDRQFHANGHNGVDFRAPRGTSVRATEDDGVVVSARWDAKGGGNCVYVRYNRSDGSNYEVGYLHLDKIDVMLGDTVSAGQILGSTGNSGNSTAPHLDFRVKKNGQYIDPLDYLGEVSVRGNLSTAIVAKGGHDDLLVAHKTSVDTTPTSHEFLLSEHQQDMVALTEQQRKNAEQGAVLAAQAGTSNPTSLLQLLMGKNGDDQYYNNGSGFLSSLISTLFMAAIGMAMNLDQRHSGESGEVVSSQNRQVQQETHEEHNATIVRRQRESVDADKLRETAMMNFDSAYPEQSQERGQHIS